VLYLIDAYIYVALYGYTFCDAGQRVWDIVCSNAFWKIIINDDLTYFSCIVGALLGTLSPSMRHTPNQSIRTQSYM
jgi:hypothetical protein